MSRVSDKKTLKDLVSVGKETLKDFEVLGIKTVEELANKDARNLYAKLCLLTGAEHDICVEDVFTAAIKQARNLNLPPEKCQWRYWSKERKKCRK